MIYTVGSQQQRLELRKDSLIPPCLCALLCPLVPVWIPFILHSVSKGNVFFTCFSWLFNYFFLSNFLAVNFLSTLALNRNIFFNAPWPPKLLENNLLACHILGEVQYCPHYCTMDNIDGLIVEKISLRALSHLIKVFFKSWHKYSIYVCFLY